MTTFIVKEKQEFADVFRAIREMGAAEGMNTLKQTQLITALSELLSNALKYAGDASVKIDAITGLKRKGIKVVISDTGPGIADIKSAMTEGYSTSGSFGLGLPGAKKLSDAFEIASVIGQGTIIKVVKYT